MLNLNVENYINFSKKSYLILFLSAYRIWLYNIECIEVNWKNIIKYKSRKYHTSLHPTHYHQSRCLWCIRYPSTFEVGAFKEIHISNWFIAYQMKHHLKEFWSGNQSFVSKVNDVVVIDVCGMKFQRYLT